MSDYVEGAELVLLPDPAATNGGKRKAVAHITWDRNATAAAPQDLIPFTTLKGYFGGGGSSAAPHVLWDPFTGRVAQYYPAWSRSKSLVSGSVNTNRDGAVVLQIEALFFPYCRVDGKVYPRLVDTPLRGWDRVLAWARSNGVPDFWPMGKPVNFDSNRNFDIWHNTSGWYGHSQVPFNDHQDPGSWPDFSPQPVPPAPDVHKEELVTVMLEKGKVGDESAMTFSIPEGEHRLNVSSNYCGAEGSVDLRFDVMNINGSVRSGNIIWDNFVNCQWGFLPVTGPATVAVQRLNNPWAHVAITLEKR